MQRTKHIAGVIATTLLLSACTAETSTVDQSDSNPTSALLAKYTSVRLSTEAPLSDAHRRMIPLLIEAADEMNAVFWKQAYGDRELLLADLEGDDRRFAEINYGPWDRLNGNAPFLPGVGEKADGAEFYPSDITKDELNKAVRSAEANGNLERSAALTSLYTLVSREQDGSLTTTPYSTAYSEQFKRAADKLRQAAEIAEDPGFKNYLTLRAEALLSDDYLASDLAWMDMRDNVLDIVIGPIETYEDQLFGYRAAAEAYVLIKDVAWSERLARYAALLPELQRNLPVSEEYRRETPGGNSQLNAYDVIYYAGDCNAGSKTIAINLPNDERVQLEFGTRRLQLKNAMRAKFDKILLPIAGALIDPEQRGHVNFDAFFANTMFHEVAHGLGIKNTIDAGGTVRQSMQELASALEEGKADVLGLFMLTQLEERGELDQGANLEDNMVTFVASIFRSIRFGSSSAHGTANLIRFNYFQELGAFSRDAESGTYRVNFEKMRTASNQLAGTILRLQGDGDYDGAKAFVERYGNIEATLQSDLDGLGTAGIPVDIVFEQGTEVLGI